jgi:D-alanyl-lipoteichoic acid acyltransferase DltB (MBOAT superfamily)
MLTSVCVNLGMLGYFKYGGFLLNNFVSIAGALGIIYHPPGWDIVLPVGISFYTFATLSYTLDVYLRRSAPAGSFLNYALFVTFFPHLVAGPSSCRSSRSRGRPSPTRSASVSRC